MMVMCAAAQRGGATRWAFKFRSYAIDLSDLLYHSFPEAKLIFLYRHASTWAQSFARAFPVSQTELAAFEQDFFAPLIARVNLYRATHTTTIPYLKLLACSWLSTMEQCVELQRQGISMFCARFEDLKLAPREVIDALLSYCGLSVADRAQLERVLAQDSQAGTTAARPQGHESPPPLSKHDIAELERLIQHYAPAITPNMLVGQTLHPLTGSGDPRQLRP